MTALAFTVGKRGADPLTQIFSTLGVVQWEIDTCSLSWDTAPKTLEIQRDKSVFCMPMRRLVAGGPRMASGLGLIDQLRGLRVGAGAEDSRTAKGQQDVGGHRVLSLCLSRHHHRGLREVISNTCAPCPWTWVRNLSKERPGVRGQRAKCLPYFC